MAVREHFGRVTGGPLLPGLHVTLPWPLGRIRAFPVKTVHQMPIGFIEADQPVNSQQPRALLWTKPHAKEEFALVLGGGTELVAVNAIVYFKIAEDRQGFLDYVYQQSMPEEALTAFAYRALMEETRGRTLDEVLSADRAAFARRLVESVRQQSRAARLGLEVVDLALLNLHPPIEAGGSYLDVINARLDAGRRVTEAEGERQVALLGAETRGSMAVATARTERSHRVSTALAEVAEFKAVVEALDDPRRTLRLRLWIEALEGALAEQRLFLVDRTLLDEGGELLLDTRRIEGTRLPSLDALPPTVPQDESK
jgi:regulator of protease activity HflC (stomatin/prohibitin superfamily)